MSLFVEAKDSKPVRVLKWTLFVIGYAIMGIVATIVLSIASSWLNSPGP